MSGGDPGGACLPLHDDEEAAFAVMHVLIHVQDAHDVGAARGLPVVVHLLPGLGAVIQELWEIGTKGVRLILLSLCSKRPGTCPSTRRLSRRSRTTIQI